MPPELISLVVLPPLLYAASEELAWRDLRAVWRPVAVLAIGLVMASAAAVAALAGAVAALSASMAFVLGAVLASTDPVAVSALGRRLSLPARVQALVQAESLFNDGTSLVLFQVAVSVAVGGGASAAAPDLLLHGAAQFGAIAGGGVLAGIAVGVAAIVVRRRIADPVLETVAALITPYGAFLACGGLSRLRGDRGHRGWRRGRQVAAEDHHGADPFAGSRRLPDPHLRAGKRRLQPDRPAAADPDPGLEQHPPMAAPCARRDRNPDSHPPGMGVRSLGGGKVAAANPSLAGRPPP